MMVNSSQTGLFKDSVYLVEALSKTEDGIGGAHGHTGKPLTSRRLGGKAARGLEEKIRAEHVHEQIGAENIQEWAGWVFCSRTKCNAL